ncbi:hypothetical protein PsYK624_091380 [Phanerochaete sordida]|uniref:Uncharacterized protein n=1 Tax=Phanerochaete sordida TaxID=48140 RepID=A0A9P3LFT9_9APHY|nr:hypothetical protein PsYK624_091380 [Phanerochaete sordida]
MSKPPFSPIPTYPSNTRYSAAGASDGASGPEDVPALSELDSWPDPGMTQFADIGVASSRTTAQYFQGADDVAGQNYANAVAFSGDASVDRSHVNATANVYTATSSVYEEPGTSAVAFSGNTMSAYTVPRSAPLPVPTQWSYDLSISFEHTAAFSPSVVPSYSLPSETYLNITTQPWNRTDPSGLQGAIAYSTAPGSPLPVSFPPPHSASSYPRSAPSQSTSSFSELSAPRFPASAASFPTASSNGDWAWLNDAQAAFPVALAPVFAYDQRPDHTHQGPTSSTRSTRRLSRPTRPRKVTSRLDQFPGDTVPPPVIVDGAPKCPHCDIPDGLSRHIKQHYAHLTEVVCTGRLMLRDAPYALVHSDRCVDAQHGRVWAGGCRQRFSRQDALKRHLQNESLKIGGCLAP